jgi:spore maturation protein CgeB
MIDSKSAVIATEFRYGSTGAGLAHGMRRQGWAVREVDSRCYFPAGGSFAARIGGRLLRGVNTDAYNADILADVDRYEATVFLTVKGLDLYPQTLEALRARGVSTVNVYPDVHFQHAGLDETALSLFDLFVTTKSFQIAGLNKLLGADRVRFLHHGYVDGVQQPHFESLAESDFVADVTYVGNHTAYKEEWLSAVAREMPGIRLSIVGWRWDSAADPELRKRAIGYALDGDAYSCLLQRSRINVAFHAGPTGPDGWEDMVSTRTFEIPACKGFMLHIDNPEVRSLYEPEREIGVFADKTELTERISHYLAVPALRTAMIERAYARTVPAYGYDARAATICGWVDALRSARRR